MIRNYIILIFLFLLLASCQKELVYHPFESEDENIVRHLGQIHETLYTNQGASTQERETILFSAPSYDSNGLISTAYNNIAGYEANYYYNYSLDRIVLEMDCKNGKVIRRNYKLKDGMIQACIESSNTNNFTSTFNYKYDGFNRLYRIDIFNEESNSQSVVLIEWNDGNIISVKHSIESGYSSNYTFKYYEGIEYRPQIPLFFTTCYVIGSVFGIDEILSMQNFFGMSLSKKMPNEVYFGDISSQIFEYVQDENGFLYQIDQFDKEHKKKYRTYTFKWY